MTTPTELQLAEQALDRARGEWLNLEDDAALDRYVAAVVARNEARAEEAATA